MVFWHFLKECKEYLPNTDFLLLSNGRVFSNTEFVDKIKENIPLNTRIAIPVYSDSEKIHDEIIRVKGGFKQTIVGIKKLLEKDIDVEIRIVVLKKNSRVLSRWKNHLLNTNLCKGLFLVIFDDEADAASLNTLVNRNKVSTMNKKLAEIKSTAASTIYIEVTATPQAVILQSNLSGWKPKFVYYFKPGSNYLGGNYFYPKVKTINTIYTPDYELDEIESGNGNICPLGLSRSIMSFLINCAHRKINDITNCNFIVYYRN